MKLVALLAGAALVVVPSGTAFAGETGGGKAWGNCGNSSAGGNHAPTAGAAGNGNGGLRKLAVAGNGICLPAVEEPVLPPPAPPHEGDDGTQLDG